MAEVLPPVLQQSASISLLHNSSDPFQSTTPTQSHSSSSRLSQMPRTHVYNGQSGMIPYRGPTAAPVAPYAFQSTPHLRQENRTTSAPGQIHQLGGPVIGARPNQSNASSVSTNGSTTSSSSSRSATGIRLSSKDDFALPSGSQKTFPSNTRPMSTIGFQSSSTPDLSLNLPASNAEAKDSSSVKASQTRYRRNQTRSNSQKDDFVSPQPSPQLAVDGSLAPAAEKDKDSAFQLPKPGFATSASDTRPSHSRQGSDDGSVQQGLSEQAKRYRRRSANSLASLNSHDAGSVTPATTSGMATQHAAVDQRSPAVDSSGGSQQPTSHTDTRSVKPKESEKTWAQVAARPNAERRGSSSSAAQVPIRASARPVTPRGSTERRTSSPRRPGEAASQRPVKPSPLSRPMQHGESAESKNGKAGTALVKDAPTPSSAAQHLQALNDKDQNKNVKSRLRRAFSFGSSAELRRASAQNNIERERTKLHKEPSEENTIDAKTAAEVAAQEAAGLGNSIYSQGQLSGSTDNLSLASTASSASMMLRKMGKGMKKSARSVKGLFRPKSVIGVPSADGPSAGRVSTAEVSMVTVEAERERVNVNLHPNDRAQGETDFPHLERNSIDASRSSSSDALSGMTVVEPRSRKSIIGSDADRDEVLKAVRKGILKRVGTGTSSNASSPVTLAIDPETPLISGPVTPLADDASASGAQKTQSLNGRHDYFSNAKAMTGSTRSLPASPHVVAVARNIAWNPRIQFHDVWSPTEYDRRGDIATCNRLTPTLAQQIKEELNTFKMEMEVHELSKPHTHFF